MSAPIGKACTLSLLRYSQPESVVLDDMGILDDDDDEVL